MRRKCKPISKHFLVIATAPRRDLRQLTLSHKDTCIFQLEFRWIFLSSNADGTYNLLVTIYNKYRRKPVPFKKIFQLHEGLSKRESALLVRLRTEKIGLKDLLFQYKVPDVPRPRCGCAEIRQTVSRILLRGNMFKNLRNKIF